MTRALSIIAAIAALLLCLPILVVLVAPFHITAPQWDYVGGAFLWQHLAGTLILLAGTVTLATLLGVGSAWCIAMFDFPGRRFFSWAFVMPLALPTYISALAYAGVLGATGTWSLRIQRTPGSAPGHHEPARPMHRVGSSALPYVYLPARAAFSGGLTDAFEASRTLGASPFRRFVAIALPLARPAIVGGAVLVCMESLNDYGAVKHYGAATLTTGIFRSWGGLYDQGSAMRLATVLLVLVASLLITERMLRRKGLRNADHRPMKRTALCGKQRRLVVAACILLFFFSSACPSVS
ncbi:MAG: iron ABC transporter permease [Flavobacteriales bacterium]|nr:iron ABC transporter permease [Flavobacteriales bacterium]